MMVLGQNNHSFPGGPLRDDSLMSSQFRKTSHVVYWLEGMYWLSLATVEEPGLSALAASHKGSAGHHQIQPSATTATLTLHPIELLKS